jgi:hypothetical protein
MPTIAAALVSAEAAFAVRSDGKSRELDVRLADGAVNIAEMSGFVGDGSTDDIIPVKAAIAKALSEGKGAVIRPAGCSIAISEAVFLGFAADQTNPSFSLALLTPGPSGNHESQGGAWKPLTNDFTAIKVGPGQHMRVIGQSVQWTGSPTAGCKTRIAFHTRWRRNPAGVPASPSSTATRSAATPSFRSAGLALARWPIAASSIAARARAQCLRLQFREQPSLYPVDHQQPGECARYCLCRARPQHQYLRRELFRGFIPRGAVHDHQYIRRHGDGERQRLHLFLHGGSDAARMPILRPGVFIRMR